MSATITLILTLGGWIIAGTLAFIGVFNKQSRERKRDEESTATTLINNLKSIVDLQEETIKKMKLDMETHSKERDSQIQILREDLKHLGGRNSVLEELFKGRDPQMQEFLKNAPMMVEMIKQDHAITEELGKSMKVFNEIASKFFEVVTNNKTT